MVAGPSEFLSQVIAQKLKGGFSVLHEGRKFENDAGDKVGIGLGLDGNSHFHAANHKDGLNQAFLERSAREFRTFGFAEAGKRGLGLGDGHAPFDVPEAIRIALAVEVLRLAREQTQRNRREKKKPHYLSMSDFDAFRGCATIRQLPAKKLASLWTTRQSRHAQHAVAYTKSRRQP